MIASTAKLLLLGLVLVGEAVGQYDPNLVGTWSTKSKKVITGPVRTLPLCHDALLTTSGAIWLTERLVRGSTIPSPTD